MVIADDIRSTPYRKRKLSMGQTIGDTFAVTGRAWSALYTLSLIAGIISLPAALLIPQVVAQRPGRPLHPTPAVISELVAFFVVQILVSLYVFAAISDGAKRVLDGGAFDIGAALRAGLRRYLPMCVSGVVFYVMLLVGLILLVVPGIVLGAIYGLAPTLCVIERRGPFASLSRSAFLTRDNRWRCFGVTLILLVVPGFLLGAVGGALGVLAGPLSKIVVTTILNVLVLPVFYVFPTALAHGLKRLKEGGVPSAVADIF